MTGPEKNTQNIAACSSYGTNSFSVAMAVASYVLYKFCMFRCIPYELYVTEFWEADHVKSHLMIMGPIDGIMQTESMTLKLTSELLRHLLGL